MQKRRLGFTLVELLIVIVIIGILASLAFPAFGNAMTSVKKAQAYAMINQLKTALTAYNTEYGVWPYSNTSSSGGCLLPTDAYPLLIGCTTISSTTATNSRGIVFMEFQKKDLHVNGTGASAIPDKVQDPWKQDYNIWVDTNYSNNITLPDPPFTTPNNVVNSGTAIWSQGPPDNKGKPNTKDATTFLKSW